MRATRLELICGMLFVGVSALTQAAEMRLVPVSATGPHTIVDNKIIIGGGGERIVADVMISGWAPAEINACQASIDTSGYTSGSTGSLSLSFDSCSSSADCLANVARCSFAGAMCTQDSDCEFQNIGEFCESGRACEAEFGVPGAPLECDPVFITTSRADYVFRSNSSLERGDFRTVNAPRIGAAIVDGSSAPDPGIPQYIGTVVLDVSPDATGTFVLRFVPSPSSTIIDASTSFSVTPLVITPLIVAIKCFADGDCDDGNPCTDDVCNASQDCVSSPNFNDTFVCCNPTDGSLCEPSFGLPGDTDGDSDVDLADAALFQTCFGLTPLPLSCERTDPACDCGTNAGDYSVLAPSITGPNGP